MPLRAGLRVLEKHLVEIAEPKQQQRILRQFAFDAAILRHHGRELGFGRHNGGQAKRERGQNRTRFEMQEEPCARSRRRGWSPASLAASDWQRGGAQAHNCQDGLAERIPKPPKNFHEAGPRSDPDRKKRGKKCQFP